MAYEPTNWKTGDVVTSAKLNKLEQGVAAGSGVLVVNTNEEYTALNKTWKEIHDAAAHGKVCVVVYIEDDNVEQGRVSYVGVGGVPGSEIYEVNVIITQGTEVSVVQWFTDSESGYPAKNP